MTDNVLQSAVERTFKKYGESRGGVGGIMQLASVIKHAAKAVGQQGTPGSKSERQQAVTEFVARAREQKLIVNTFEGVRLTSSKVSAAMQSTQGATPSQNAAVAKSGTFGSPIEAAQRNSPAKASHKVPKAGATQLDQHPTMVAVQSDGLSGTIAPAQASGHAILKPAKPAKTVTTAESVPAVSPAKAPKAAVPRDGGNASSAAHAALMESATAFTARNGLSALSAGQIPSAGQVPDGGGKGASGVWIAIPPGTVRKKRKKGHKEAGPSRELGRTQAAAEGVIHTAIPIHSPPPDEPSTSGLHASERKMKELKKRQREEGGPITAYEIKLEHSQGVVGFSDAALVSPAEDAALAKQMRRKARHERKALKATQQSAGLTSQAAEVAALTAAATAAMAHTAAVVAEGIPDSPVAQIPPPIQPTHIPVAAPKLETGSASPPKPKRAKRAAKANETPATVDTDLTQEAAGDEGGGVRRDTEGVSRRRSKRTKKEGTDVALEEGVKSEAGAEDGDGEVEEKPAVSRERRRSTNVALEYPSGAGSAWREQGQRQDVKSGRYSEEEKQTLRDAALECAFLETRSFTLDRNYDATTAVCGRRMLGYAREHGHSETDLMWLFSLRKELGTGSNMYSTNRGAWQTIAEALPHRTPASVYYAGTRLLHPMHNKGKWTDEENEALAKGVAELGERWSEVGGRVGRLGIACRDRWRIICLGSKLKSGVWDLYEDQKLIDLVETYMDGKEQGAEEKLDRRTVRDDVNWTFIAQQHGSRTHNQCLDRWYHHLAPSMLEAGIWGSGDDRRLLRALLASGVTQEFEVNWINLVDQRSGVHSKRRWNLMVKHVPEYLQKSFDEQLNFLVDTFAPQLRDTVAS